jgi:hypothetical protein
MRWPCPKTPEEFRQELERLVAELDPVDLATVEITPTPDEDDEDAADLDSDPRVKIQITPNWDQVLTATLDAILPDPELFRRGSDLVSICKQTQDETKLTPKTTMRQVAGSLKIIRLSDTLIGCALTRNILFTGLQRRGKGKPKLVQVNPPGWLIGAVATFQHYPGMRVLRGVMECPFFRSDGSLVEQPGYDAATETLLVSSNCEFLPVPESPTQEDAWEAANRLFALTSDFPFPTNADWAAWLAGLLTPLAREAIDGPVPGLAECGNKAGIGKGLLIDVIGTIVTGRKMPKSYYPPDPEEAQKVKVSIALDGSLLTHFDNVPDGTSYGNSALDSAITSTTIDDRILGSSKRTGEIPWRTCCFLSGNNITPGRDAHRRWLMCNLITELERPQERNDLTIANLAKHVEQHRAELLRDALTILRAHFLAGQPSGGWGRLGSFEAWDQWIRGAIWFATGEDCCSTLRKAANESPERLQRIALLEGWLELEDGEKGVTVAKMLEEVTEKPNRHPTLHRVLMELGSKDELASSKVIGNVIRGMKRTVNDDMRFEEAGEDHRAIKWRVVVLTQRKKDELQDRKEQDALKQTVLDEEHLKYLSETLLQGDLSTEVDAACTAEQHESGESGESISHPSRVGIKSCDSTQM